MVRYIPTLTHMGLTMRKRDFPYIPELDPRPQYEPEPLYLPLEPPPGWEPEPPAEEPEDEPPRVIIIPMH